MHYVQQSLFFKKTQIDLRLCEASTNSILQDVAADIFGVLPDLGLRSVLVSVQEAQSVHSGVGEACGTFRAGPEEERQSAETR